MSDRGRIHVCTGTNKRYLVRVRYVGCRNYIVKSRHREIEPAVRALGRVFATGKYKRGDVVMVADYYGPLQLVEMVSRQQ
jgi:predicted nucleic acid-binding Zn finger protein